jgi:chromosome segregation ATPase
MMKEGRCIMGEMRKDRGKLTDTEVLVETYEKDIWKLKELLSRALQDTNTLEGTKRIVVELTKDKNKLKKEIQELQNEMILIKGITVTNSPELRAANAQIKNLEDQLSDTLMIEDDHQKLNGKLQMRLTELEQENKELRNDNKKLALQTDDQLLRLRKAGL